MELMQVVYLVALGLGGGYLAIAGLLQTLGAEKDFDADHADFGGGGADFELAGADVDVDVDVDVDLDGDVGHDAEHAGHGHDALHDGPVGVSWLSPMVVAMTLLAFGVTGFSIDRFLSLSLLAFPTALALGWASGWTLRRTLSAMRGLEGSSHTARGGLIAVEATVITSIPAGGVGEIAYTHKGMRNNAPARNREDAPLPKGALVFISKVDGSIFEVEETREARNARRVLHEPQAPGRPPSVPETPQN